MRYLNFKNGCGLIVGLCVVFLATIALLVPSERLATPPWRWAVLASAVLAVIALVAQMVKQSREDTDLAGKVNALLAAKGIFADTLTHPTAVIAPLAENTANLSKRTGIEGELYRIVITGKGASAEIARDLFKTMGREFAIDVDILVEMYMVNTTNEKQFVRDIVATVEVDGKILPLTRQNDFYAWEFNGTRFEYCLKPKEGITFDQSEYESLSPLYKALPVDLEARKPLEGWIHFVAKEIDPEKLDNNHTFKFTIIDSLGNKHPITKGNPKEHPGRIGVCRIR
jgi:hypothetical protein